MVQLENFCHFLFCDGFRDLQSNPFDIKETFFVKLDIVCGLNDKIFMIANRSSIADLSSLVFYRSPLFCLTINGC